MEEELLYLVEDAAKIVFENISEQLKQKLTIDEIITILDIEFEYQMEIGMAGDGNPINSIEIEIPFNLDEDEMKDYMIKNCFLYGIVLTYDELNKVLDGEDKYLKIVGLKESETFDYGIYFN